MKTFVLCLVGVIFSSLTYGQTVLTPEGLWQLGRVSAMGITEDGQQLIYRVSTPVIEQNASVVKFYSVPVSGGTSREIPAPETLLKDKNVSPDGKYTLRVKEVKIQKVFG